MSSFIESCLLGHALLEEIDDYVDRWHEGESDDELHRFLGMSKSEYNVWLNDPSVLPLIIVARKQKRDLSQVLEEQALPMAARSDGTVPAKLLVAWLKREGLWEK